MFGFSKKKQKKRDQERERDLRVLESQQILLTAATETADAANVVTHRLRGRLEESIAQFENTARIMNDALVICDLNGKIQAFNPAAEVMFGMTTDQARCRFIGDLLLTELETGAELWGMLESTVGADEMVGIHADGRTFPIDLNHTQLDRTEGAIVLLVMRDRSPSVEAKSYRSIFESSFDGIFVVEEGIIVAANPAVSHMFGYSVNELLNNSLDDLLLSNSDHRADAIRIDGSIMEVMFTTTRIWWNGNDASLVTVRGVCNQADDKPMMVCCFDADYTITFANCLFSEHYGKKANEVIGIDIRDLMDGEERHLFNAHIKGLTRDEPTRRMHIQNSTSRHVWTDHAHFPDGKPEFQRIGRGA